ncbi:MAG: NADH:ubiquinone reductase (Na(+)-transporting) subunit C [Vicinamibacterales bacterium]
MIADGERVTRETVRHHFEPIELAVVDLRTGEEAPDVDPYTYDQRTSAQAAGTSHQVPGNLARLPRLPHYALVYKLMAPDGQLQAIILPVEGKGLWSTLYGFLALESDLATVRGLTFYQHGETPGLGGEVDNPRWKALWRGRSAFDQAGRPAVQVIRGKAGSATEDPYRVDGISGATLTSNGVSNLIRFWLGDDGFGPYLERLRGQRLRIEDGRASADASNSDVRNAARARRRPAEGEAP